MTPNKISYISCLENFFYSRIDDDQAEQKVSYTLLYFGMNADLA